MSQPKGKVPAHIKPKTFDHPGTDSRIVLILCEVEDPRQPSCNFHHSVVTIIFISLNGKTLRGSRGWSEEERPLHLLHAWSTELGACIGQVSVDEKSNEITAFPKLIERLELQGTIVTTNALNTQKKAATAIIDNLSFGFFDPFG